MFLQFPELKPENLLTKHSNDPKILPSNIFSHLKSNSVPKTRVMTQEKLTFKQKCLFVWSAMLLNFLPQEPIPTTANDVVALASSINSPRFMAFN